jgi:hypothetical protein
VTGSWPDERTRPGLRQLRAVSDPPSSGDVLDADEHVLLGKVMAETVQIRGAVNNLTTEAQLMRSEVSALRRDIELDRKELVKSSASEAAKAGAGHASNRMAVLLGLLYALYTEAAPVLHELWRVVHK